MEQLKRWWFFLTFDATKEYGEAIPYTGKYSDLSEASRVIQLLKKSASDRLPKGLYYEIRLKVPQDFGRDKGVAWYSKPCLQAVNDRDFYFVYGGFYA